MRRLLLLGATAMALLAPASGASAAAEKSLWGPTMLPAGHPECPPAAASESCWAFPLYRQLGVDTFQFQLTWSAIAKSRPAHPRNPNDPAYVWLKSIDSIIREAAANGITLAAMVKSTPSWANGGRAVSWAPTNAKDYADFLYAASKRYPGIARWMIWGEPNYGYHFLPMPVNSRSGPRHYARILDAAYGALKQAGRKDVVIGGMTVNSLRNVTTPDFIRWLRVGKGRRSRPPRVDWWGHNPFEARRPRINDGPIRKFRGLNDLDTLHRELKAAYSKRRGGPGKAPRLWISEWTVLSERSPSLFLGFYVSAQEQAQWIDSAYQLVNKLPYVRGLGWFKLEDQAAAWGLLDDAGGRKPSFYAFKSAQ
jgi:hypothetical protein